ncbi:MAG: glutamate racemase [Puniceicoccales bacterium]|jgi:glutamate racemase|nr:glutamate racemase [Puniceicoccales bacterium]
MFDSGIGGLTIRQAIAALLPNEAICYYADTAHCPYGPRPPAQVTRCGEHLVRALLARRSKLIVVACNTATTMAIDTLRRNHPCLPFVGVEPALKPAAHATRTRAIGILATTGTLHGRHYNETRKRHARDIRVYSAEGTGLVELVEAGKADSPEAEALLRQHLGPMLAAGIDQLVLGCTHYPFLEKSIRRIIGEKIQIHTPAAAVARRVHSLLSQAGLLAPPRATPPPHTFHATGSPMAGKFPPPFSDLIPGQWELETPAPL